MTDTKWMYVVRPPGETHKTFATRMRGETAGKLMDLSPSRLKLTVTDVSPPRSFFGFKKQPVAVFCVWGHAGRERYQSAFDPRDKVTAYEVDESTPVAYNRTWPDGSPTPTPILLTILHKKRGLSDAQYIDRWHNGHTPLSLKIHPLWYYQRNVIVQQFGDAAGRSDGIVEEACDSRETLLKPTKFYGGAMRLLPNMMRVLVDIIGFLDLKRLEVYYATEFHIKS